MFRTTIMLPEPLKMKLEREAEREKISFGEMVRQALGKYLLARRGVTANDPFLSSQTVFKDKGPTDVSEDHDTYLLEKGPHR